MLTLNETFRTVTLQLWGDHRYLNCIPCFRIRVCAVPCPDKTLFQLSQYEELWLHHTFSSSNSDSLRLSLLKCAPCSVMLARYISTFKTHTLSRREENGEGTLFFIFDQWHLLERRSYIIFRYIIFLCSRMEKPYISCSIVWLGPVGNRAHHMWTAMADLHGLQGRTKPWISWSIWHLLELIAP